jgi:MFS family permease
LKEEFSFIRGNYLVLVISWILIDFANELPATYYPDYVIQLGGSPTILGLITLVKLSTLASVQFLGGYLADKYGRKRLISTLTFGVALSCIFYAIAPSWHFIMIGAAIESLCLIYQPALDAIMADSLAPEKRGMGFSILNLIMSVTTTPAPAVALLLVAFYGSLAGMRIAFIIVVLLIFVAAIVRQRLKESIQNTEKIILKKMVRSYPKAFKESMSIWKIVPSSMRFLFFSELITQFSLAMTQSLFLVYSFYTLQIGGVPHPELYAAEADPALQLARVRWGYVLIILFICMIVLSFPIGKVIDKIGRKTPLIIANLLMIPALLLFVFGNYITLFVAMALSGLAVLLSLSCHRALFSDIVPQTYRGKVRGFSNFFIAIFMGIGGAIGGILYDQIGPQIPFLLVAAIAVPATLMVIFCVHEPKPEERQS